MGNMGKPTAKESMRVITINVGKRELEAMDKIISWGFVCSRSEFMRGAAKRCINEALAYMDEVEDINIAEKNPILKRDEIMVDGEIISTRVVH